MTKLKKSKTNCMDKTIYSWAFIIKAVWHSLRNKWLMPFEKKVRQLSNLKVICFTYSLEK